MLCWPASVSDAPGGWIVHRAPGISGFLSWCLKRVLMRPVNASQGLFRVSPSKKGSPERKRAALSSGPPRVRIYQTRDLSRSCDLTVRRRLLRRNRRVARVFNNPIFLTDHWITSFQLVDVNSKFATKCAFCKSFLVNSGNALYIFICRATRSRMISSEPPPIAITRTSR